MINFTIFKKYIFLFVGVPVLFVSFAYAKTNIPKWEEVKVSRMLDTQHLLLNDGRVIKIIGIDAPDLFDKRAEGHCYARSAFRLLKFLLEGKTIKILADEGEIHKQRKQQKACIRHIHFGFLLSCRSPLMNVHFEYKNRKKVLLQHVKLENGDNLTELMLSFGMARFQGEFPGMRYEKKYRNAENVAISGEEGVWGGCGIKNYRDLRKRGGWWQQEFRKKYGLFLAPISVGRVKKVYSGWRFQLENGLVIKMIGIEVPVVEDRRGGFACFGREAKEYLESMILGRRVILRKDISDLDKNRELLRYVFLPEKRRFRRFL